MLKKITESDSYYSDLEKMETGEILAGINKEDHTVAFAVQKALPQIEKLVNIIVANMKSGGRLFYIGAGTSGRLGILDASECPPTFGVSHDLVIGLIAGGDAAIRKAVENAEDNTNQAIIDLEKYNLTPCDTVVGIAASGTTPYVIGGLEACQKLDIKTGCISCNPEARIFDFSDYPVLVEVGPEFVTGSTRMKSGTAQKMVLNMITTATMIKIGRVKGSKMVDMQLSNDKLVERGINMIMELTGADYDIASELLTKYGHVRKAVEMYKIM